MAKLKIRGHNELVEIGNERAKNVKKIMLDDSVSENTEIDLGDIITKKKEISLVLLDSERRVDSPHNKALLDYYKKRDELLSLSPRERAEISGWGHFSLFYFGLKGEKPNKELKEKIIQIAEKFFEENSKWSRPSYKIWEELLEVNDNTTINPVTARIFSKMEEAEIQDIKSKESYENFCKEMSSKEEELKVGEDYFPLL